MNSENKLFARNLTIIIPIIVALLMFFHGVNINNGAGERTGQFVAIQRKGFFCKTWEAELIKGGMSGGSGSFGVAPFWVTVPDIMVEQVEGCLDNQTEVKISYYSARIFSPFSSDSGGDFLIGLTPSHK